MLSYKATQTSPLTFSQLLTSIADVEDTKKTADIVKLLVKFFLNDTNILQNPANWDSLSIFFLLLGTDANKIMDKAYISIYLHYLNDIKVKLKV